MDYSKLKKAELVKELEKLQRKLTRRENELKKLKSAKPGRGKAAEQAKQKELTAQIQQLQESEKKLKSLSAEQKKNEKELVNRLAELETKLVRSENELKTLKDARPGKAEAAGQVELATQLRQLQALNEKQRMQLQASEEKLKSMTAKQERNETELTSRLAELEEALKDKTSKLSKAGDTLEAQVKRSAETVLKLNTQQKQAQEILRTRTVELQRVKEKLQEEIQQRERAETALRELQERRPQTEDTGEVKFSFDAKLRVLEMSPSVQKWLGYSPEELVGRTIYELEFLAQESLKQIFTCVQRVLGGEEVSAGNCELIAKDGTRKLASLSSAPLAGDGDVPTIVCTAGDIRECAQTTQTTYELEPQKILVQELKKLDPIRSQFLSVVKHELSTPIVLLNSAVKMFLDGVLGEVDLEQKKLLEMMGKNMEKLLQFTTEVVTLAQQEAEKAP